MTKPKAIFFDVIGTLVDWRGSITDNLPGVLPELADTIAREWVRYYCGDEFVCKQDLIDFGEKLVDKYRLNRYRYFCKEDFIHTWTTLSPWKDSIFLHDLQLYFPLVSLTNVTTDTMIDLSRRSNLPFDWIFSAEIVGKKKPNAVVYETACHYVGIDPSEGLMVAAHRFDLRGAREVGMQTCYVERNDDPHDSGNDFDLCVENLQQLYNKLCEANCGN